MKIMYLIIIGITSILVFSFFSIAYGEFENVPYSSCDLNLKWEYSEWFGVFDYMDQLQRCISNIPFTIQNAFADQFVYDSTLHPESEKSREQLERYCVLHDKPNLKDGLFYNNSTHYIISKDCVWKEVPICVEGTVFFEGRCEKLEIHKSPGSCVIATATFGSELAPQVQMLREIRDNTLLSTESGKLFMNGFNAVYYSFSPTIAQWENQNPAFKELVKLFITPMIATLSIMTIADDSEIQVILYGLSTIGLIVGMYVVVPVALVWKIKKIK